MLRQDRPRRIVLLIEDNVMQSDLYALVLRDAFDVVQATRGETGFQLAVSEQPDAIVLDVMLPDLDGLAVAQRLSANPATAAIPIVILTGDAAAYARAQLMCSMVVGVLTKPCPADQLLRVLHEAVE